jgi:DNA-binding transcriptional MerR regulator
MNAFTIKDLENLTGIKAHTIRIWEQRYNFLKPHRSDTNIRYYSNEEVKAVLNIALLNKYGYKISHIGKMDEKQIQEKILSLVQIQAQQERVVNELIQYMIDLDMQHFEETLNKYIKNKGIERTITQIIFPFLERIGILWLTNHINPAQEHLVTNIIRSKLIMGLETTQPVLVSDTTLLLFLPEGEHHEIGLLFAHFLLKTRGINVLYLGASIPLKDVAFVANLKKPNFLYCHLTAVANNFNFEKFLHQVKNILPQQKVVISGVVAQNYKKELPPNVILKKSLSEVTEYIASL